MKTRLLFIVLLLSLVACTSEESNKNKYRDNIADYVTARVWANPSTVAQSTIEVENKTDYTIDKVVVSYYAPDSYGGQWNSGSVTVTYIPAHSSKTQEAACPVSIPSVKIVNIKSNALGL